MSDVWGGLEALVLLLFLILFPFVYVLPGCLVLFEKIAYHSIEETFVHILF
jgi:hypothetical protein